VAANGGRTWKVGSRGGLSPQGRPVAAVGNLVRMMHRALIWDRRSPFRKLPIPPLTDREEHPRSESRSKLSAAGDATLSRQQRDRTAVGPWQAVLLLLAPRRPSRIGNILHHVRIIFGFAGPRFGLGRGACMGRPEEYRRYAEECLKLASGLHEPSARAALRHMAQVWLRLAQDAESRSRPEDQSA
jgi:hypothetical protein